MYLKLNKNIKLIELGNLLLPNSTENSLDWDYENVYEWMYVDIPNYKFSLNISRDHGMSDIDDNFDEEELNKSVKPGPIYIFGWDRKKGKYINDIPDSLIEYISEKVDNEIVVYPGRVNMDNDDPKPIKIQKPNKA